MRFKKIRLSAVSLMTFAAFAAGAEDIKVMKHQKSGMSESRTTMSLSAASKGKCMVALETALGRSDEKDAGSDICKTAAKMIGMIKVARDEKYVLKYCPASYEKVSSGKKEKFYCIKGKRTDGKEVLHLNRFLSAVAVRNFRVDF